MEKLIKIGFVYENFNFKRNSKRHNKNIEYPNKKKKTIIAIAKNMFARVFILHAYGFKII